MEPRQCLLLFEPPDGGVAENVLQLALGLPNHGWRPFVVGPADSVIYERLAAAGVPVAKLPLRSGFTSPRADLRAGRALARLIREHDFDLVHAHSAKAGVIGRLAAYRSRTPVVYSPHSLAFVGPWGAPRRLFATGVERALGRLTARLICVCEDERRLVLEHKLVPEQRSIVVYNGSPVQPEGSVEPDPALRELAGSGPLVGSVAVLRPQKAIQVFVEAMPAVLREHPETRFAVVGDGPLRAQLEERANQLGLGERVAFFDFVRPGTAQLAALDLFVLPSAWEAFPISLLEAMACGVPQIATDVGGSGEAVAEGETGLLCPPGDSAALASRINTLLADQSTRARMSAASRKRHSGRFTVERMVEETAEVYRGAEGFWANS